MTRFWEQLTPAQRRRVVTRLRRSEPTTEEQAAPIWDGLGLPERNALLFGSGLPREARRRFQQAEETVASAREESAAAAP